MKDILILGSGKKYGLNPNYYRCVPRMIQNNEFINLLSNNNIKFVDMDIKEDPDFVANICKPNWWFNINGKYDIIIDTVTWIKGPTRHTNTGKYRSEIILGINELLKENGIFYGHE